MFQSLLPTIAVLPRAPLNASPVPWLTSLYHKAFRGDYGDARYPGNCSGELIKDLLLYFKPKRVLDPMTGSGTCADVCRELGIECVSLDIREGDDACDYRTYIGGGVFDFIWVHPPYWRMKKYTDYPRDLSNAPTLDDFLERYQEFIGHCSDVLSDKGHLAILMGDYEDRDAGYVPLVYHTQRLCFEAGFKQPCTQIIRFSHGASSSKKVYKSSFIPGLHDVCTIVQKPGPLSVCVYCGKPETEDRRLNHGAVYDKPDDAQPMYEDWCYCDECAGNTKLEHSYFAYCARCEREFEDHDPSRVTEDAHGQTTCLRCLKASSPSA